MAAQDIIIRPVITEKAAWGAAMKKYTFEVAKTANKIEISQAIEELCRRQGSLGQHHERPRASAPSGQKPRALPRGKRHRQTYRRQQEHRVL